jgi:carboxyl-terminal processing protease
MRKTWRTLAIVLFTAALLFGGLFGDRILALNQDTRDYLKVYTELVTVAQERYGKEVPYRDLVFASIQGMLRSLDPHTSFLSPQAYEGMRERQQSSFYGLGILVSIRNGQLTVIAPIEGTPASRMGLRAGDIISNIEGEPTDTMSLDEAVTKLKGPKDTQVNITINRRGLDEPLELSITRAEIPQSTVRQAYMLTPDVGYVQVSEFSRSTGTEMADALAKLRKQGMEKLILDLRNNGGGLLDQAIEVSDQFVPEGSSIVETRGRIRDSYQSFHATGDRPELGLPVVVLVNGGTASAAEILSGAIQDHDVGLIVGTPTWGKGLVQTVYSLSYGAGLALTTAKYYTPSGRLIQRDYTSYYDYYNYDPLTAVSDQEDGNGAAGQGDEEGDEDTTDGTANGAAGKSASLGGSAETGETPAPEPKKDEPVFHTDLGRAVYGGGGITPDVVVQNDEVSAFELFLLSRNAFFEFGVDYTRRHPVEDASWQPGDTVIREFRQWLSDEGILEDLERFDEALKDPGTRDFIRLQIRAEVFNSAFGQEASHRVRTRGDKQVQAALEQLGRARELLEKRAEMGQPPLQPTVSETEGKGL